MVLTEKTLGVDFVDFFRARRTRCKPAVFGNYLDSSDSIAVSGSGDQNLQDRLTSNLCFVNVGRRQFCQSGFLFMRSGSIDAFVDGISELAGELAINLTRIF